jgi:hypothetical protein
LRVFEEKNLWCRDDSENRIDKDGFAFADAKFTDLSKRRVPLLLHGLCVIELFKSVGTHRSQIVQDLCQGHLGLLTDVLPIQDFVSEGHLRTLQCVLGRLSLFLN